MQDYTSQQLGLVPNHFDTAQMNAVYTGGTGNSTYVPDVFSQGLIGIGAPPQSLDMTTIFNQVPVTSTGQVVGADGKVYQVQYGPQQLQQLQLQQQPLQQQQQLPVQSQQSNFDNLIKFLMSYSPSKELTSTSSDSTLSKKTGKSAEFNSRVEEIAKKLNCDPDDIIKVMKAESGLCSDAVNKSSNATGLIQFMPSTAQWLGTTTDELKKMSPEAQLDYVEKYLVAQKKAAKFSPDARINEADLYALVFMPAYAKKFTLCEKGTKLNPCAAYDANAGLDIDKDGKITKMDLKKRLSNC